MLRVRRSAPAVIDTGDTASSSVDPDGIGDGPRRIYAEAEAETVCFAIGRGSIWSRRRRRGKSGESSGISIISMPEMDAAAAPSFLSDK